MELVRNLILIDGYCNLCHGLVQFITKHDTGDQFHFSHLQSPAVLEYLSKTYGIHIPPGQPLQTVVLLRVDQVYLQSDAVLQILHTLNGRWRILSYLGHMVPRFIRNALYKWIAKNRFYWFGEKNNCQIPEQRSKTKFLSDNTIFKMISDREESRSQSY